MIRIAREFARNAERTNGRSMIMLGAGTNHWFHNDQIYRAILSMLILTGCQGVNGGGWAHYVGQEKVRPISGWSTVAFGLDWQRPPRQQATTPFWFLMSDQFRFQRTGADHFSTKLGNGSLDGMHLADCYALAARLGWMPSYPTFDRNPLEITATAEAEGIDVKDYVVRELQSGGLRFAAEDPDGPGNWPRVLTLWRANLLGSSSKGHEYFLRHVLGVENDAHSQRRGAARVPPARRRLAGRGADRQVRPVHDDRLPHERLGALLRHRPACGDVVREARPLVDRPAPVRALVQRGRPTPVGDEDRLRDLRPGREAVLRSSPRSTSACARISSRHRSCTTRRASSRSRSARCATGRRASASPFPG